MSQKLYISNTYGSFELSITQRINKSIKEF